MVGSVDIMKASLTTYSNDSHGYTVIALAVCEVVRHDSHDAEEQTDTA